MTRKLFRTAILGACLLSLAGARPSQAQPADDGSPFEGDVYEDEWVEAEPEGQEAWVEPEAEVDVNYFFQQLAPYGEWIWLPEHGWVWRPNEVAPDWQPYTNGRWVYTDHGWTWASSFAWGWAPFHYGRWSWLDHVGWIWVPGSVWGPAWVIWRYSDSYVGWSPLMAGYDWYYGWSYYPVYYSHWTFINWNHFCSHRPHHHYLPRGRSKDHFRHTYYPRRCRDAAGPGCRRGPARRSVERVARVQIPKSGIRNVAKAKPIRNLQAKPKKLPKLGLKDDTLSIYRPRTVVSNKAAARSSRPATLGNRRSVDLGVVQRPSRARPSTAGRAPSTHQPTAGTHGPVSEINVPTRRPSRGANIQPRRPSRPGIQGNTRPRPGKRTVNRPSVGKRPQRYNPTRRPSVHRPKATRPSGSMSTPKRPSTRPSRSFNRPSKPSKSNSTYKPSSSRSGSRSSRSKGSYRSSGSGKSSSSKSSKSSRSSSSSSSRSRRR